MPILRRSKYHRPKLPAGLFLLVDADTGVDDGPFRTNDFAPAGGGVWVAQTEGRPVFLRVTKQEGDEIWTVDGEGKTFHYRIVPVTIPGAELRS